MTTAEQTALKEQLADKIKGLRNKYFEDGVANDLTKKLSKFNVKKTLSGHFQKVYSIHWGGKGTDLFLSASQDGKLIVWNALTTNKVNAITLEDNWVMTCAFEQERNELIATGGLKNICYIYEQSEYKQGQQVKPIVELVGHDGYVSCCRFISQNQVVTSSGDGSCRLWDIEQNKALCQFTGHTQDVMSVSIHPDDKHLFVTGSIDKYCKLWDTRLNKNVAAFVSQPVKSAFTWDDEPEFDGDMIGASMIFKKHESDINSVAFLNQGFTFGSGSDDTTCRLWDIRSHQQINYFNHRQILKGINSIDFSISGRLLFAGDEERVLRVWDTLKNPDPETNETECVLARRAHDDRVSAVSVHTAGKAVATASWDSLIKVFA